MDTLFIITGEVVTREGAPDGALFQPPRPVSWCFRRSAPASVQLRDDADDDESPCQHRANDLLRALHGLCDQHQDMWSCHLAHTKITAVRADCRARIFDLTRSEDFPFAFCFDLGGFTKRLGIEWQGDVEAKRKLGLAPA